MNALETTDQATDPPAMQQIPGMLKETGWLWLLIAIVITVLVFSVHIVFCVMYPLLGGFAIYIAFVRYDQDGNQRNM